jgi:hypothetical protein
MKGHMSREVRIGYGLSDQRWITSNSFVAAMSRRKPRDTLPIKWIMGPSPENKLVRI